MPEIGGLEGVRRYARPLTEKFSPKRRVDLPKENLMAMATGYIDFRVADVLKVKDGVAKTMRDDFEKRTGLPQSLTQHVHDGIFTYDMALQDDLRLSYTVTADGTPSFRLTTPYNSLEMHTQRGSDGFIDFKNCMLHRQVTNQQGPALPEATFETSSPTVTSTDLYEILDSFLPLAPPTGQRGVIEVLRAILRKLKISLPQPQTA